MSNESGNASEKIGADCCDAEATASGNTIGRGGSDMVATASENAESANGSESGDGLLLLHYDFQFRHCPLVPVEQHHDLMLSTPCT